MAYDIRPAEPSDAEAYVACHVECLAETYATLMPPAFVTQYRDQADENAETLRAELTEPGEPGHGAWLATDASGMVVGLVRTGAVQAWEAAFGAPPAPLDLQLQQLYTRASTHGTGLGGPLLDAALGDRRAYLWILYGNPRADAFYRRHGFAPDGVEMDCGPAWFRRRMYRMVR